MPRDIEVLLLVGWAAVASSIAMVARGLLLATGHTLLTALLSTLMGRLLTLAAAVIILQFIEPDHTLWAVAAYAVTPLIELTRWIPLALAIGRKPRSFFCFNSLNVE